MDFSNPINWMSPFPNLGVSGAFFYFDIIIDRISCKQTVKTLIRRRTVCLLGLYGLITEIVLIFTP